jgi:hypothetical protein
MSTAKINQGSRAQLSGAAAALNSAGGATATFVTLGTITHNSSGKVPLDCVVELAVTAPATVGGGKMVWLYAQASLDGTNFGTGPTSGTSTTDLSNLRLVGGLPLNSNGTLQRDVFSLAAAHRGGVLPFATKLIAYIDVGAALPASGHDVYTADYTGDLT